CRRRSLRSRGFAPQIRPARHRSTQSLRPLATPCRFGRRREADGAGGAKRRSALVGRRMTEPADDARRAELAERLTAVRGPLAGALDRAAARHRERPLEVLVQVSLDGDLDRGGAAAGAPVPERDLDRVIAAIVESATLRLRGVMTVAPLSWTPEVAFSRLAE